MKLKVLAGKAPSRKFQVLSPAKSYRWPDTFRTFALLRLLRSGLVSFWSSKSSSEENLESVSNEVLSKSDTFAARRVEGVGSHKNL